MTILLIVGFIAACAIAAGWLAARQQDTPDPQPVFDESADEEERRWSAIGWTLTTLANSVRHTRRLSRVSFALVVLDLILSVFFAVSIVQSHEATRHAERASAAAVVASNEARVASDKAEAAAQDAIAAKHTTFLTCQASNSYRAGDKQLWDFLLGLFPPGPTTTPEQLARINAFRQFLAKHDAQRTCVDG